MGRKTISYDSQNTSPKEVIRKNIRHALNSKNQQKYPNINLSTELFPEIDIPIEKFTTQFRQNGGLYIPCELEQLGDYLKRLITSQKYGNIFCAEKSLCGLLSANGISYTNVLTSNDSIDAMVTFSSVLIARNGSVVFSQKYQKYPSIKGIAKDIIVIAKFQALVPSLKDALQIQTERNQEQSLPFYEIITPSFPEKIEEQYNYTPQHPRIILFLIYAKQE